MTSDSLALWLADRVGAEAAVLVKAVANTTPDAGHLAATGYLDEYFPRMMEKTNVKKVACVCLDDLEIIQQALVSGVLPHRIRLNPTKGL